MVIKKIKLGIKDKEGYEDDVSRDLSRKFSVDSYRSPIETEREYKQFDPWFIAAKFYDRLVGLTEKQRASIGGPETDYIKEVGRGLLRLVELDTTETSDSPINEKSDNKVYFPTEKLLGEFLVDRATWERSQQPGSFERDYNHTDYFF